MLDNADAMLLEAEDARESGNVTLVSIEPDPTPEGSARMSARKIGPAS